jgi:hypothetical protein
MNNQPGVHISRAPVTDTPAGSIAAAIIQIFATTRRVEATREAMRIIGSKSRLELSKDIENRIANQIQSKGKDERSVLDKLRDHDSTMQIIAQKQRNAIVSAKLNSKIAFNRSRIVDEIWQTRPPIFSSSSDASSDVDNFSIDGHFSDQELDKNFSTEESDENFSPQASDNNFSANESDKNNFSIDADILSEKLDHFSADESSDNFSTGINDVDM